MLVGVLAKIRHSESGLDRRKQQGASSSSRTIQSNNASTGEFVRLLLVKTISVVLPFYATMLLGQRAALVLLAAITSGLVASEALPMNNTSITTRIKKQKWTVGVILLGIILDSLASTGTEGTHIIVGYLALATSILVIPPPLPSLVGLSSLYKVASSNSGNSSTHQNSQDIHLSLISGGLLGVITIICSSLVSIAPTLSSAALAFSTLSIASAAGSAVFMMPSAIQGQSKMNIIAGCLLIALVQAVQWSESWSALILPFAISGAIIMDKRSSEHAHAHHNHKKDGHHHDHHAHSNHSRLTKFLLDKFEPGSIVYEILVESDSRRIAYFAV